MRGFKVDLTVKGFAVLVCFFTFITPLLAGYVGIRVDATLSFVCYFFGSAGLLAGSFLKDRHWRELYARDQKRRFMQYEIDIEQESREGQICDADSPEANQKETIAGETFDRMQRAIAAFPVRYQEYKTKPPKLDDDVRPWLKESGFVENEAEKRVFGAIIREHFNLSPDTQKPLQ